MATSKKAEDVVTKIVSLTNKLTVEQDEEWEVEENKVTKFGLEFIVGKVILVLKKCTWLFGGGIMIVKEWPKSGRWEDAKLDALNIG